MFIKEFRLADPMSYLHLVNCMRLGLIKDITISDDTARHTGRLVASHPERGSFSLLVEHTTRRN